MMRPWSIPGRSLRSLRAVAARADNEPTQALPRTERRRCAGPLQSRCRRVCAAGRRAPACPAVLWRGLLARAALRHGTVLRTLVNQPASLLRVAAQAPWKDAGNSRRPRR
eukprot:7302031-Alexandrium_andersonii.AAC.1